MATDNKMFDDELERALVRDVFHKAFRHMLNEQECAFFARGGTTGTRALNERWDDKVREIRQNLNNAKTRLLCRGAIMKILSDANACRRKKGQSGKIESSGGFFIYEDENNPLSQKLWGMLNNERDYAKVRDLALLSLVTFTDGRLGGQSESR